MVNKDVHTMPHTT